MVETVAGQKSYYINRAHFADDRMAGSVPTWKHGDADADSAQNISSLASGSDDSLNTPAPRLSFGELLDVVNPLHHLPVVGGVYRHITGDEISSVARIAGGGLYGGPIGAAASLASAAIEEHTGKDIVSNVMDAGEETSYGLVEEQRTAGGSRKAPEIKDDPIEVAALPQVKPKPIRLETDSIIENLPAQKPITKVEIAEATPVKQVWKFNA